MDRGHRPVLLEEAIAALMVSVNGTYVDGTFGRGGHSTRILDILSPLGTLAGFDQDPAAAAEARPPGAHPLAAPPAVDARRPRR